MRHSFLPVLLATMSCTASPALADTSEPGRLIAVLSGDWNGDEDLDAVTLVLAEDGMADLVLYEGGYDGLRPVLTLNGQIFAGPMAGQTPRFSARGDGGFVIEAEQTGVGREPWFQYLTVAYREGQYLVAGYTYDFYDRLDLGNYGTCDVNLLTGAYSIRRGQGEDQPDRILTGQGAPSAFPLANYVWGYTPEVCATLFRE